MPICTTQKGKFNFKFWHVHYMYAFNSYLSYSLGMLFQYQNLCPMALLFPNYKEIWTTTFRFQHNSKNWLFSLWQQTSPNVVVKWAVLFLHILEALDSNLGPLTGSLCLFSVFLGNSGLVPGHNCFLPSVFQFTTGTQYHVIIWHYTIWATESNVRQTKHKYGPLILYKFAGFWDSCVHIMVIFFALYTT